MVAMEGGRIEPSVRLDRPAVPAELDDEFSHNNVSLQIAASDFPNALFRLG